MLTRVIVEVYVSIIEIYVWFMLLIAGVVGYHVTVPILDSAGLILEHEIAWKILGVLLFPAATFLLLSVFLGPMLVLVDIRNSVRNIATKNSGSGTSSRDLPTERSEPSWAQPR